MRVNKTQLRLFGFLIVLAALVIAGLAVDPSELLTPEGLRASVEQRPVQAAAVFLATGVGVKLLFIPFTPLSAVAGFVFGGLIGGALAFLALLLSSVIVFGLARWLGRAWVEEFVEDDESRLRSVERLLREHGLLTVVVLRIVPTLPLSAVNVVLGQSSISYRDFMIGTSLGTLPGAFLLAYVGSEALEFGDWPFWILVGLSALLVLCGILIRYRLRARTVA